MQLSYSTKFNPKTYSIEKITLKLAGKSFEILKKRQFIAVLWHCLKFYQKYATLQGFYGEIFVVKR